MNSFNFRDYTNSNYLTFNSSAISFKLILIICTTKVTTTTHKSKHIVSLLLTLISFGPLGKYPYLSILTISYYFHNSLFHLTHKVFNDASTIIMPRFIIISETPKEESLFRQSCPKIPIHPL